MAGRSINQDLEAVIPYMFQTDAVHYLSEVRLHDQPEFAALARLGATQLKGHMELFLFKKGRLDGRKRRDIPSSLYLTSLLR